MNKVKITNAACRAALDYMRSKIIPDDYHDMTSEQRDEWDMRAVRGLLIAAASATT